MHPSLRAQRGNPPNARDLHEITTDASHPRDKDCFVTLFLGNCSMRYSTSCIRVVVAMTNKSEFPQGFPVVEVPAWVTDPLTGLRCVGQRLAVGSDPALAVELKQVVDQRW